MHASFVHLTLFWKDFQKTVKNSFAARTLWNRETGFVLTSFSTIKWWSMYDVLEQQLQQFDHLLPWLVRCIDDDSAVNPVSRLITMITGCSSRHFILIELAAYAAVGSNLRLITYFLEGDGQLVFITWAVIDKYFFSKYPSGAVIPDIAEINGLAADATRWATSVQGVVELGDLQADLAAELSRQHAQPQVRRPRRVRRNQNPAALNPVQRARKAALEKAQKAAEEKARKDAVEAAQRLVAEKLASLPPQSVAEWQTFAKDQVQIMIDYVYTRLQGRDAQIMKLFKAASVFHPDTLAAMSLQEAKERVELLRAHPRWDDDTVINELLAEVELLHQEAVFFTTHRAMLSQRETCMAKRKSLVGNGTATCYREAKVVSRDAVNATYSVSFTSDLQVETVLCCLDTEHERLSHDLPRRPRRWPCQ